jgi:hypothetical protein
MLAKQNSTSAAPATRVASIGAAHTPKFLLWRVSRLHPVLSIEDHAEPFGEHLVAVSQHDRDRLS